HPPIGLRPFLAIRARREFMKLRLFLVLVVCLIAPLIAQTVTGTMRGNVTDRSGAVLPAQIVVFCNVFRECSCSKALLENNLKPFRPNCHCTLWDDRKQTAAS